MSRNISDTLILCVTLFYAAYAITYIILFNYLIGGVGVGDIMRLAYRYLANEVEFEHDRILNALSSAMGIAGVIAAWMITGTEEFVDEQISGRVLTRDLSLLCDDIEHEGQRNGIAIAPDFFVSQSRERQHLCVIAETGAGKTQILMPIIAQSIKRGDKVFIYDFKGDLTPLFPSNKIHLFAPWLSGSVAWDIAADVLNAQDAKTFAASIIPEDKKNPFFCNSSRDLLAGLIMFLQNKLAREWGFCDLAKLIALSTEEQYELLRDIHPIAAAHIEKSDGNTAANVKSNLNAAIGGLIDLADAWGNDSDKISIRDYLTTNQSKNVCILQGNTRYKLLTTSYINAIISVISSALGDYQFEAKDNKIWLILDEFQELGRIDGLETILAVARGKGVRCVLSTQDAGRVIDIYGADIWSSIYTNCGTKIIGKTTSDKMIKTLLDTFGEIEVKRQNETFTNTVEGENKTSRAASFQIDRKPVVPAHAFGTELGQFEVKKRKFETRALVFTGGRVIGLAAWPRKIYGAHTTEQPKPAAWTRPGYVRVTQKQKKNSLATQASGDITQTIEDDVVISDSEQLSSALVDKKITINLVDKVLPALAINDTSTQDNNPNNPFDYDLLDEEIGEEVVIESFIDTGVLSTINTINEINTQNNAVETQIVHEISQ